MAEVRGAHLVRALEAGGSRRRSTLVASMCAAMAGLYLAALAIPPTRRFFALVIPTPGMLATALVASAISIGALALCGFTLRATGDRPEYPRRRSSRPVLPPLTSPRAEI